MRLVCGALVCFQVLFEVVVQLEAAVTLGATENVVHLRNLDFYELHILQYFGSGHCLLLI